jgi:lysyl-tRNA synthetase class 2
MTPPMVQNPGMETHVHPFQVALARSHKLTDYYLHTSPEFCLKELLADYHEENLQNIYSLSYCFRDEPQSVIHRPQFLMLEWYRINHRYESIMNDVEELIAWCLKKSKSQIRNNIVGQKMKRLTMEELWLKTVGFSPLDYLETNKFRNYISQNLKDVPLPQAELAWDDLFFLVHLNLVEPKMSQWPLLLVYEFPAPLAALSTIKATDSRVCERFEVYVNGVELCNAYNELINLEEQKERFRNQSLEKNSLYQYQLPEATRFFSSLEKGLPPSSGIALGVERLLYSLFEIENPFFY